MCMYIHVCEVVVIRYFTLQSFHVDALFQLGMCLDVVR